MANFYAEDVMQHALANEHFRQVLFTTELSQLVLMNVQPGEEIGAEVHEGIDQVLFFVAGEGEAVLGEHRQPVKAGSVVVVPGGTRHNFIATGTTPLKIVTVYTPPEHPDGTVHQTKAEADEAEAQHHGGGK